MVIDLHNKIRLGFSLNLIVWKMEWGKTGCILNERILSEGVWRKGDNFEKCFFIQKNFKRYSDFGFMQQHVFNLCSLHTHTHITHIYTHTHIYRYRRKISSLNHVASLFKQ